MGTTRARHQIYPGLSRWIGLSFGLISLVIACSPTPGPVAAPVVSPPTAERRVIISVGVVSTNVREATALSQPLVDYLAQHLQTDGTAAGRVIVANSIEDIADHMRQGTVDLVIDSPFPIARMSALSGARPFLRRWKKGIAEYHSAIFVREDSPIRTIQDLGGKMIAFEGPDSTAGYFLPTTMLVQAGLKPVQYDDPATVIPSDHVGYTFSGADENSVLWVLRGKVAASATDENTLQVLAGDELSSLRVLTRSVTVPRHIVAHRAGLDPQVVDAITRILLGMEADEAGRDVLAGFEKTTRFDAFDEPMARTLGELQQLISQIGADR